MTIKKLKCFKATEKQVHKPPTHTCWYTWIFNIFHFSPVNMLLKKKNRMPEPFVLEKELHEYSQINFHFELSDLSADSTKLLGEGNPNSFQPLLAFPK